MYTAKTTTYTLHRGDYTLPHRAATLQVYSDTQQPLPTLGPRRQASSFPVVWGRDSIL